MIAKILYWLLLILIGSGGCTYLIFVVRFYLGWKNLKQTVSHKKRTVSVVISARNEATNMVTLLTCLLSQDYPKELYEIIIGDDGSEDETGAIVQRYVEAGHNIRYFKFNDRDKVISPKKAVLEKAITMANGELILTTDADCLVPISWISSMVSCFTDDVSMVVGYSRTKIDWDKAGILQKYEHLDFALTYMVLGGGYTLGKSWACIGQNLAYRKSAWEDVGGFEKIKHLVSGDDVNLMHLMRRQGHKIIFNFAPKSFTYTHPVESWKQFVNQRSRWASNMKYLLTFNREFFLILFSMGSLYWGSIILLFLNLKLGLIIFAARIAIEHIMIAYTRKHFGVSAKMLRFYPIWLVIQTFMLVFTLVLGWLGIFVWHGKRLPTRKNNANSNL